MPVTQRLLLNFNNPMKVIIVICILVGGSCLFFLATHSCQEKPDATTDSINHVLAELVARGTSDPFVIPLVNTYVSLARLRDGTGSSEVLTSALLMQDRIWLHGISSRRDYTKIVISSGDAASMSQFDFAALDVRRGLGAKSALDFYLAFSLDAFDPLVETTTSSEKLFVHLVAPDGSRISAPIKKAQADEK